MHFSENIIELKPKLKDMEEVSIWLKHESETSFDGHSFYHNIEVIKDAFASNTLIIFKHKSKSIGLATWSEYSPLLVVLNIFVVHPDYREKGLGAFYYKAISDFFRSKHFKVIKLFCSPEESESFWIKMGLQDFPDCGSYEHELTYYQLLVDTASIEQGIKSDKIELWDTRPNLSMNKEPKWIWYIELKDGALLNPIIQPCDCNWQLRWTKNNEVVRVEKVKYFTNVKFELWESKILYIEKL